MGVSLWLNDSSSLDGIIAKADQNLSSYTDEQPEHLLEQDQYINFYVSVEES